MSRRGAHAKRMTAQEVATKVAFWVVLFMAFSFVGWVYEIVNDLVCVHLFRPRVSLLGPWCPIYGIGGVLICAVFARYANKDMVTRRERFKRGVFTALGIAVLVTVVELAGSYICEALMGGVPPWDYSDYPLNFEGRIALPFTVRFVIGGMLFIYLVWPWLRRVTARHPKAVRVTACVLGVLFIGDMTAEALGLWHNWHLLWEARYDV